MSQKNTQEKGALHSGQEQPLALNYITIHWREDEKIQKHLDGKGKQLAFLFKD